MNKRKIVVTGGCGYIGSHVARAFHLNGDSVFIIDRVKRDHTLKDCNGYFIDDFASEASLSTIYNIQPDVIVHCAGTSLVGPSMTDPQEYYNNNISKTIKLLDFVKELENKPVILFSSSASVYGVPKSLPIPESANLKPISPYGNTKMITELMLKDYAAAYGIDSICFRYFNAAGAEPINFTLGQEPGATHIVARVLEASISKRAFTVYGGDYDTADGTCIRDYVHVWDIANAHVLGANFIAKEKGFDQTADCRIFNLGTNQGTSNKQIVDYVVNKYGLPFVNFGPRRAGDPDELVADATDARTWLGWEPKHSSIAEIIDSAYKWYTRS